MCVFLHFPTALAGTFSHVYCILWLQTSEGLYILNYSLLFNVLTPSTQPIISLTTKHDQISLILLFFPSLDSSPPSNYHLTSFYTISIKLFERVVYTCYFNFLQSGFLFYPCTMKSLAYWIMWIVQWTIRAFDKAFHCLPWHPTPFACLLLFWSFLLRLFYSFNFFYSVIKCQILKTQSQVIFLLILYFHPYPWFQLVSAHWWLINLYFPPKPLLWTLHIFNLQTLLGISKAP